MTGLPQPPKTMAPMLPPDTLSGERALVVGTGFVAETVGAGLHEIGARVKTVGPDDPTAAERTVRESDGSVLVVVAPPPSAPEPAEDVTRMSWRLGPAASLETSVGVLTAFGAARGERGGVALMMVDPVALHGGPGVAAAAAAQAAMVGLMQSLAVEWAPRDLRVNAVAVGSFRADGRTGRPRNVPAMRLGEDRELSWLVQYLCSPYSSYLTGTTLTIDGGDSLKRYLLEPEHVPGEFLQGRK